MWFESININNLDLRSMSSKDPSVTSKEALMSTKPGKSILKQGLFKSKGFKMFETYKTQTENEFSAFVQRFAKGLYDEIRSDPNPNSTQQKFADEVGSTKITLNSSEIEPIRSRLDDYDTLYDRVLRILDSNFVKMTFPVFNALYDSAAKLTNRDDSTLRQDIVEGHIIAIDLSEPMDRIVDRDEDLEFLDDYKLMNPYILKLARTKIARGGDKVLKEFERGFQDARVGQYMDEQLKSKPTRITEEEMNISYKKYRAVMGTAGRNMALAERPLGEIFYLGMARAAESAGCGNEIEDSLKGQFIKIPSWPLYYSLLSGSVSDGLDLTLKKSNLYLDDARLALELLPDDYTHTDFLEFLFLTLEHYNQYWHTRLRRSDILKDLESRLPRDDPN